MPERDHLQCDPTSIQTKNGRGGVNLIYGKAIELESVTPAKVSNMNFSKFWALRKNIFKLHGK